MPTLSPMRKWILLALYGGAAVSALPAFAQTAEKIETVNVVGSRRVNASATDTAVPVDTIPLGKLAEAGGQFDLAQTLQYISPSFNSTRQTGADGADLVDSAALRGLGSDQTLVLMNGKRRHTTALVNLFGARNRGNTGTDMNTIPMLAVSNIQVLRDGAAAQYGSDAIAGVINISMKKSLGCEAVLGYGQYSAGDGKNKQASAYCGMRLGEDGVLSVTGEYLDRGRSNRAEAGNPRIIGDTATKNPTLYINTELPSDGYGRFYLTAGAQNRDASSGAWARGGVGSDDIPSRNSAAMYPNGFVPFINADVNDRWATFGHRGMIGDWNADFSQTYGSNRMAYRITHTLNASIANKDLLAGGKGVSPDAFNAGGFQFSQMTTNADFSQYVPDFFNGINIAFGGEYRRENYQIFAGEPGSYNDVDGVGSGGNAGSQGFPGFQPGDATDKNRHSSALYLDIETDLTARLKLQTALRYENFSDFGATTTGKLAGAYRASDMVLLRGSASTGFRAPSLQQIYFSSTFTDFISGKPMDVVLGPNGGTVANAAGIPKLNKEKSTSYTLGMTLTPTRNLSATVDLYNIRIDDRIVLSGRFDADNYPTLGATLAGLGVGQAQFFVNSVNTRTQGVDLTVSHKMQLEGARLNTYLAYNYSKTEVTGVHAPTSLKGYESVLLSERERLFIEQGGPRSKGTLGFEYGRGDWETNLRVIYFGAQTLGTFSGTAAGVANQYYAPKTSADLSFTYAIDKNTKVTFGGTNIFNVHPSAQDPNETDNGFKYESVQFGLNGAAYFVRLWKKF